MIVAQFADFDVGMTVFDTESTRGFWTQRACHRLCAIGTVALPTHITVELIVITLAAVLTVACLAVARFFASLVKFAITNLARPGFSALTASNKRAQLAI